MKSLVNTSNDCMRGSFLFFLEGGRISSEDLDNNNKAKYLANVLGFNKVSRIKNYTRREGIGQDYCSNGKDVNFFRPVQNRVSVYCPVTFVFIAIIAGLS